MKIKNLLFCLIMRFFGLNGMEMELDHVEAQVLAQHINYIVGASYFIIHHHTKDRNCWLYRVDRIKIKSSQCAYDNNVLSQNKPIVIFYDRGNQRVGDPLILPCKKEKIKNTARKKLDPNAKPEAVSGIINQNKSMSILSLYDKDDQFLLRFPELGGNLPLTENEKAYISQWVDVNNLQVQYVLAKSMWDDLTNKGNQYKKLK